MKFPGTSLLTPFVALLNVVSAAPTTSDSLDSRATTAASAAGYFSVTFIGDQPSIFAHVADAGSESTFTNLNGGNPILVPTQGQKGVRDPYLVKSPAGDQFWIIGTELNIGALNNNWDLSTRNGSTSIYVWSSSDLVTWSTDSLVDVMPKSEFNAGMVWAPSAVWDAAANSYAVFWASRVYAESDTSRSGSAGDDTIYYAHTSDFVTFTTPQIWLAPGYSVIDQEILPLDGSNYVRFIKDAVQNKVYTERSSTGLFGSWTRIDANNFVVNEVREGPAVYRDIRDANKTWLWLDNYSGQGSYEAYYNDDLTKNVWTLASPELSPFGMRHGAIQQVTQVQLDALRAKWA